MNENCEIRPLSRSEWEIINALIGVEFPGRDSVRRALTDAKVRTIDYNGSLEIVTHKLDIDDILKQIPVEGEILDDDGVMIHILLHVRNHSPVELEIYKEDGSSILNVHQLKYLDPIILPSRRSI